MLHNFLFKLIITLVPIFEVFLISIMLGGFFEPKYNTKWQKNLSLFALLILMLALTNKVYFVNLQMAAEVIGVFLISVFIYKGSLKIKAIYNVFYAILLTISNMLSRFVILRIPEDVTSFNSETLLFDILGIVLPKAFLLTFVLFTISFVKRKSENMKFRYWLELLTVPVTTLLTLSVFQYFLEIFPYEEKFFGETMQIIVNNNIIEIPAIGLYGYLIAAIFGLIVINFLVFILFSRLQNQIAAQAKINMLQNQTQIQSKSITQLENSYNSMHTLRHDLQNHLICMNSLIEKENYEELKQYIKTMTNAVDEAAFMRISGNTAIDAILNDKLLEAKKNKISTQYEISPLDEILTAKPAKIEAMDLSILISNALDNAVEACKKLPEDADRFINIKIQHTDSYLLISCSNSALEPKYKRGDSFLTDKADKVNHGFGIRSIKSRVKKYNGDILFRYENNVFNMIAKLPYKKT